MSKSKILQGMYDRHYNNITNKPYEGTIESVRRVDNFPKPKINDSTLSVETILEMIDNKLSEYKSDYDLIGIDSDDLEVGAIGGYIQALESLKENILDLKNKGE